MYLIFQQHLKINTCNTSLTVKNREVLIFEYLVLSQFFFRCVMSSLFVDVYINVTDFAVGKTWHLRWISSDQ